MLFDIGIAGPIAGFVVAVPALFIGVAMSHVVRVPTDAAGMLELGEPLLFKLASWLIWGTMPDGYSLNMHPMAFAAWFGMLATALNLFPIGQLDGGHISYSGARPALVHVYDVRDAGRRDRPVVVRSSWIVWTGHDGVMLIVFGRAIRACSTRRCRSIARAWCWRCSRVADVRALLHAAPIRSHRRHGTMTCQIFGFRFSECEIWNLPSEIS